MFVSCAAGSEETDFEDTYKTDEFLNEINSNKENDGNDK